MHYKNLCILKLDNIFCKKQKYQNMIHHIKLKSDSIIQKFYILSEILANKSLYTINKNQYKWDKKVVVLYNM